MIEVPQLQLQYS